MVTLSLLNHTHRPIVRYAVGATTLVAVGMGFDWTLAYLLPVLSLSFLAPGGKPPGLRGGFFFVASIAVACLIGMTLVAGIRDLFMFAHIIRNIRTRDPETMIISYINPHISFWRHMTINTANFSFMEMMFR